MKHSALARGIVLVGVLALGYFPISSAKADDSAANPKYSAWAKFKPGSFSTVEADMDVQGNKFHITMTRTLVSIDDDKAVVETRSTVNLMGQDHDSPVRTNTIQAKGDAETYKQTGEKEVQAMDKTFKCKVYEAKGNPGAKPDKTGPAGDVDNMKATVYISEIVPGGLVRLEGVGRTGKGLTFILTAMESK